MFYHLFYPLSEYWGIFNVLKYITFRGGASFVTAFLITIILWKISEKWFKRLNFGEKIDMYGHSSLEELHRNKKGTPTMGGVIIIAAVCLASAFWVKPSVSMVWHVLTVMLLLGGLGFIDDFLKIKKGKGLTRKEKLFFQIIIGLMVGWLIYQNQDVPSTLRLPFIKSFILDLGVFYVVWAGFVIVATSNAVNFTDGLDGLAIGGVITNSLVFAILSYLAGHIKFSQYLFIPYINGSGELTVICTALLGAGLGFLWFNSHPAEIFMGDTGALSLGGVIGVIALFIKKEFLLIISGGIFVVEALSVVIQIAAIRIWKTRVFKAAPLHHHFQLKGLSESKIIIRFWIVSIIFSVLALLTLKLR
jgi:phospho-N-acetylmuramoyl-pentapeptide-transferase